MKFTINLFLKSLTTRFILVYWGLAATVCIWIGLKGSAFIGFAILLGVMAVTGVLAKLEEHYQHQLAQEKINQ